MAPAINMLTNKLPDSVPVGEHMWAIHTSYKRGIFALDLIEKADERDYVQLFRTFFDDETLVSASQDDLENALEAILWFLNLGKRPRRSAAKGHEQRLWDWQEDAGAVIADFFRFYRVDLTTDVNMHWWLFKSLFDALPQESESRQRMYYRGPTPQGSDKQQKKFHAEKRKQYRLPEV